MNNVCSLSNYDSIKDFANVKNLIESKLDSSVNSVEELVNVVSTVLKDLKISTDFDNSKDADEYKEKVNNFIKDVTKIIKDKSTLVNKRNDYKIFKDELNKIFFNPKLVEKNSEVTAVIPEVGMLSEEDYKSQSYNNTVNTFFKDNKAALQMRDEKVSLELVLTSIIDTKNKVIVDSNKTLNDNFRAFKTKQYEIIYDYVVNKKGYDKKLFSQHYYKTARNNGNIYETNAEHQNLLNTFYNIITNLNEEDKLEKIINDEWQNSVFNKNSDFLNALNAYINLVYFDDVVEEYLGSYIGIDEKLVEPITIITDGLQKNTVYKYKFNSGNTSAVHGWETSENRDALKELGKFSKLLIESIPMLDHISKQNLNINVNAIRFNNAFTTLKNIVNKLSQSEDNIKLKNLVNSMHYTPESNVPKFLKIIFKDITNSNPTTGLITELKNLGLSNFDLDVLYSVYNTLYKGNNSYHAIENEYISSKGINSSRYPIVKTLLGVIDSTVAMNYLQTKYNENTNDYETSVKTKYIVNKNVFDFVKNINMETIDYKNKKELLEKKYNLSYNKENSTYSININGTIYTIQLGGKNNIGILTKIINSEDNNNVIKNLPKYKNINFSTNEARRRFLEDDDTLTAEEKSFKEVLLFIDTMLKTTFTKDVTSLLELSIFLQLDNNNFKNLFTAAARALVVTDIYNKFETFPLKDDFTKKYTNLELEKFLKDWGDEAYPYTKLVSRQDSKSKNQIIQEKTNGKYLNTISAGELWVHYLAQAKAIVSGEISTHGIKNMANDTVPNYSPAFEGSSIHRRLKNQADDVDASSYLLFAQHPGSITEVVVDTDVENIVSLSNQDRKSKKAIKSMTKGELLYHSIVDKYILPQLSSKPSIIIQPTTYSDKTKFLNYIVNDSLKLGEKTQDEIILDMLNTVGKAYFKVFENVLNDYAQVFNLERVSILTNGLNNSTINTIKLIENKLKNLRDTSDNNLVDLYYEIFKTDLQGIKSSIDKIKKLLSILNNYSNEQLLVKLFQYNDLTAYKDSHYRNIKGNLYLNEILYNNVKTFNDKNILAFRLRSEKIKFINALLKNKTQFKLNLNDNGTLKNTLNDLTKALINKCGTSSEAEKWKKGSYMILAKKITTDENNKTKLEDIIFGESVNLKKGESLIVNPLLESFFLVHSLVGNNLRFSLSGSEINHKVKYLSKQKLNTLFNEDENNYILNELNIDLKNSSLLDLDLALQEDIDSLTQAIAFDAIENGEEDLNFLMGIQDKIELEYYKLESLAQGAQLKRNVIIPATLRYYLQNTLEGIGSTMKMAVFEDVPAKVFNFDGLKDTIDAHDGSAFVDPFTSRLENLSLQDNEVGTVKKPIWHHYDNKFMTATLAKYAVDTITNQWMRQSELANISLRNLFKKMTNLLWTDENGNWVFGEIDLIYGCDYRKFNEKSTEINFKKHILEGSKLYYKKLGKHYQITDFGKDEKGYYTKELQSDEFGNAINNTEIIVHHYFDAKGNHSLVLKEGFHTINSLYELHSALGGIYSESLTENGLQYSEASVYAVTNFINNVAIAKEGVNKDNVEYNQTCFKLPLKEAMINYAAANSAIKNGVGNINPTKSYYDDSKLTFMTISTEGHGVLMDADHESDEALMTEFSLVISSLDAGGRLHDVVKSVYNVLGLVALDLAHLELNAIKEFKDNNNISEIYDIIGKTIINNLNYNRDRAGLASAVITAIKSKFDLNNDHALDDFKIPFSDPNVYSNILSTFVSILNQKSIKRKYPGLGTVMVPGYNISMVWDYNGDVYQFEDLLKIAESDEKLKKSINEEDTFEYNKKLVEALLQKEQDKLEIKNTFSSFLPTDNVNILNESNTVLTTVNLDDIDTYYQFKLNPNYFVYKDFFEGIEVSKFYNNDNKRAFKVFSKENPDNFVEVVYNYDTNIWNLIPSLQITSTEEKNLLFNAAIKLLPDNANFSGLNSELKLIDNNIIKVGKLFNKPITENFKYQKNIFKARNLKPSQISFTYKNKEGEEIETNIFDTWALKDAFLRNLDRSNKQVLRNVQSVLDNLANNKYLQKDGTTLEITSLNNSPAELIMSNIYKSKYKIASGESLLDVKNSKTHFLKNPEILNSNFYDLVFTKNNQKHLYVTFNNIKNVKDKFDYTRKPWHSLKRIKFDAEENSNIINKVVAIDKDNNILFEVGRDILNPNVFYNTSIKKFVDSENKVLKNLRNFRRTSDNLVLEYVEYLNKNQVIENGIKHTLYNFNLLNINRVWNLSANNIVVELNKKNIKTDSNIIPVLEKIINLQKNNLKLIEEDVKLTSAENKILKENNLDISTIIATANFAKLQAIDYKISDTLSKIYKSDSYSGVLVNTNLKKSSANILSNILKPLSENLKYDLNLFYLLSDTRNILIEQLKKYEETENKFLNSIKDTNAIKDSKKSYEKENIIVLSRKYRNTLKEYNNNQYLSIKASFDKSQFFTASRIPAQTLQSFMLMKCVGYTGTLTNLCFVSHWQTWLLGSDYDIDKAYIMGHNFDDNGIYVGWSNLFDYSSLNNIQISENLPMPTGLNIINVYNKSMNFDSITNVLDLTPYEDAYINAKTFKEQVEIISKVSKVLNEQPITEIKGKKSVKIKSNKDLSELLHDLRLHESTELPILKKSEAYKNFIASHIENIILDVRNAVGAYSPIAMEDVRDGSMASPKGNESLELTLLNPAMVYIMQYENMTGKNVIGIAANGEKASFMWHYYCNEALKSGDPEKIKHIFFNHSSSRIKNRTLINLLINSSNIDVLMKLLNKLKEAGLDIPKEINKIINKKSKSELDFEIVLKYLKDNINEIISEAGETNLNMLPDVNLENVDEDLKNNIIKNEGLTSVDLMISEILSAATDNAKELILAKINAGNKLAKCYLYLITLGYDINDIVSFMTSPTVLLIDDLSEENIYNIINLKVEDAVTAISGTIPDSIGYNILKDNYYSLKKEYKINDLNTELNTKFIKSLKLKDKVAVLDYLQFRNYLLNARKNIDLKDLNEFKRVLSGANEFSNLGKLLGLNLGLPTNKEGLQALIYNIQSMITSREKELGLGNKKTPNSKRIKDLNIPENLLYLIGDFNFIKFLNDDLYKQDVIDYYDFIKVNVNIFDVITSIPQFSAILELLKSVQIVDYNLSTKTKLFDSIVADLKVQNKFIDEDISKRILRYIDDLIILNFFNTENIEIPIPKGVEVFDNLWRDLKFANNGFLKLQNPFELASFKRYFENVFIPNLKEGKYFTNLDSSTKNNNFTEVESEELKTNPFILNLIKSSDRDMPLYKCNLDMMTRNNSANNKIKFLKYLKGLEALSNFRINNIPLSDLFIIYNLIANKNQYGSDRMTNLLENMVKDHNKSNLINKYFLFIGNLDYTQDISQFKYALKDVILATATVKYTEEGPTFLEKIGKNKYQPLKSGFIQEIATESPEEKWVRINNKIKFGSFNIDYRNYIEEILKDLQELKEPTLNILNDLVKKGILIISNNC